MPYASIQATRRKKITWLCADDQGGGIISVAEGCCRAAALAGHEVTLLLALSPTGHASGYGPAKLASLEGTSPYTDIPEKLIDWLKVHPQDFLVFNGCDQADTAIPFLPQQLRVVYCVHDTANRYHASAIRFEASIDSIVAVTEIVAGRFRDRLKAPDKLRVVHNGTEFSTPIQETLSQSREDNLIFLGGDNPVKGAYDVLALWSVLIKSEYPGRLHWFGSISDSMRLKISQLPCADRILLYGRMPRSEIFRLAGRSKVFLMLSRAEPFGMATVECLGMGCLAVAWDISSGTKEIITESEAVFAPLGDYNSLARSVEQALRMHDRVFSSSIIRVREEFGVTAMWERYNRVFEETMTRPLAKRSQSGGVPPHYRAPWRLYQILPAGLRARLRSAIGRSPYLGYAFRDFRGK